MPRPVAILVFACLAATPASADDERATQRGALRDPTQPPQAYGATAPAGVPSPLEGFRPEHLVSVNGKRYLMWKGRRYAVGDTLQGARIERIEETEVWFRTDQGVRKLKLFAGVEKSNREPTK